MTPKLWISLAWSALIVVLLATLISWHIRCNYCGRKYYGWHAFRLWISNSKCPNCGQ